MDPSTQRKDNINTSRSSRPNAVKTLHENSPPEAAIALHGARSTAAVSATGTAAGARSGREQSCESILFDGRRADATSRMDEGDEDGKLRLERDIRAIFDKYHRGNIQDLSRSILEKEMASELEGTFHEHAGNGCDLSCFRDCLEGVAGEYSQAMKKELELQREIIADKEAEKGRLLAEITRLDAEKARVRRLRDERLRINEELKKALEESERRCEEHLGVIEELEKALVEVDHDELQQ